MIPFVLNSVHSVAPGNNGILPNISREPKDLFLAKPGLCYDRSRVVEKILRYQGFDTRHISLYSLKNFDSKLDALLSEGISSRAVSEVKTSKGWMLLESNCDWIAQDLKGDPISVSEIQRRIRRGVQV